MAEEQFLAMLRFEQRSKLGELPDEVVRGRTPQLIPLRTGCAGAKHISVKAAEFSDCNVQYLRRLLRNGRLEGIKIGQVRLIDLTSLETYARNGRMVRDRRHGPRELNPG